MAPWSDPSELVPVLREWQPEAGVNTPALLLAAESQPVVRPSIQGLSSWQADCSPPNRGAGRRKRL